MQKIDKKQRCEYVKTTRLIVRLKIIKWTWLKLHDIFDGWVLFLMPSRFLVIHIISCNP